MSQIDEMQGSPTTVGVDNPFPGLRPFKIEESHLFFGREGQSDEVLLKLSKSRFVGVIGPSGSGKSSFIYCGVLPILYGGFLTDTSPNWEVVVTRPGAGPIDNLAESLLNTSKDYNYADPEEKKIKRTIVSTLLRSSSLGLVEAIQQSRRSSDINYLVLVDQFEELFRFKDSTDPNSVNETLAFVNLLMEAINYEDAPIYVAITMRSDFIGDCAQFPELTRKINDSHYLIPQMTRDQKRRAIEGPVAVGNAKITPRLVQQLLNDLGDNPDQLPILQHALMRTWSYWSRYRDYEDEQVDLKHYEAIGTMSEALSMHANEAYDELDEDQKRICEVLFKAITEKRGENFGIRRPTRLNEIASIADVSEDDVIEVIEKFREPGRSLLTPGFGLPLGSKSMVDISHESLMRIWVRLKNWVDDEADAVQMYLRLAEAANMYQVGKAGLWRPPDLQLALNWQVKHKPTLVWGQRYHPAFERTMIFLEYSKKEFETEQRIKELEAKRKLQRARTTAIVFGVITGFALVALVYAFVQQGIATAAAQEAIEQRAKADQNAIEARKQRDKAVSAQAEAEVQRKNAVAAAIEAKKQQELAQEAEKKARESEARAKTNEADAIAQRKVAEEQKKKADKATEAALKAQAEAERQSLLAIGKAISLKSTQINDKELHALLAQQGYNFNTKNAGYPFDNDVYNGLFYALKAWSDPMTNSLNGHTSAARAVVTSLKNNSLYSGGSDGRIIQWKLSNGLWQGDTLKHFSDYQIYSMDISSDGNYLAVGGLYPADRYNNFAYLFDLRNSGAEPKKITGFISDIENINFTPDNKGFFARANSGKSIMYSDLSTAKEAIDCSKEKITSIDLNTDGTKLVGGGVDGNLYIWDVKNNYAVNRYNILNNKDDILAVAFDPKGYNVIIGAGNGELRIVTNGIARKTLTGHSSDIEQIKFSHSGSFMVTASKDKSIRLWNYDDLTKQPQVLNDHDWVWSMAFTPDDNQLMAGINSITTNIPKEGRKEDVDYTIHAWPTKINSMSGKLCGYIKQNMSKDDWDQYIGSNIKYQSTCPNLPSNYK
ncbi:MAG: High-affnity carbon uptake protein Hat/HatR [Bacteroidetes bacterium]|nr:High-affnity carbon uptake protein Hat/HatR [Bacteroidota bacterium]